MCNLCDDYDGGSSCDDCGIFVCFDVKGGDDLFRPAYVTSSGDLKCDRCGPQYDREIVDDWCHDYDPFDDDLCDEPAREKGASDATE